VIAQRFMGVVPPDEAAVSVLQASVSTFRRSLSILRRSVAI